LCVHAINRPTAALQQLPLLLLQADNSAVAAVHDVTAVTFYFIIIIIIRSSSSKRHAIGICLLYGKFRFATYV